MSFFPWNDAYLLHIDAIDAQHRHLVDLVNAFYATMMTTGATRDTAGELVRSLARYAREHFALEERCMEGDDAPAHRLHRAEHEAFTARVVGWLGSLSAGEPVSTLELAAYLRDWLNRHILDVDQQLADMIRAREGSLN